MADWEGDNWNIPGAYFAKESAILYDLKTAKKPESKGRGWTVKKQKEAESSTASEK